MFNLKIIHFLFIFLVSMSLSLCKTGKTNQSSSKKLGTSKSVSKDPGTSKGEMADYYAEMGIDLYKKPIDATKFQLFDLDGKKVKLDKYKGKVVLMNFWFLDCPFCKKEKGELNKLNKLMKGKSFEIVSVNVDGDGRADEIPIYVEETGMKYTLLRDPKRKVSKVLTQGAVPTSFIINKEGFIIAKAVGDREWAKESSIKLFKGLLSGNL